MKIEKLKERIQSENSKLEKLNGTLERHQNQLNKKESILKGQGVNLDSYNRYDYTQTDIYWTICEYESKINDCNNTKNKISEVKDKIHKLDEQLKNQIATDKKNENLIPEVLNVFLEKWKQECIEFYIRLTNQYIELLSKKYSDYEITKENLEKIKKKVYSKNFHKYIYVDMYTRDEIEDMLATNLTEDKIKKIKEYIKKQAIDDFINNHFATDMYIVNKILQKDNTINNLELNQIIDEDVKGKKEMFINKIKQVIGDIKDLTDLFIANNGEINGIAKGIKCNAKIQTIQAGGHNIQCKHFRVLVNTI